VKKSSQLELIMLSRATTVSSVDTHHLQLQAPVILLVRFLSVLDPEMYCADRDRRYKSKSRPEHFSLTR
jgi:hypothetical protein